MSEDHLNYLQVLLSLCRSLTLCEHQGDVGEAVLHVLKLCKISLPDGGDDWGESVRQVLGEQPSLYQLKAD